jgi:3-oxoadipate enol-lactonase
MWLAAGADPIVRELTEAMTIRSYEQQLPLEESVQASWPQPPAAERLADIDAPTLVIVGTEDVADILAMADRLAAGIPGARLATIEGAGHLPSLERPDELNRLLLDFLR